MIGKKLRVNDYKLTYGQETLYINMYGAFKYNKNGNKYAIYSYENKNKLNYGSFFQRGKETVIMTSKEDPKDIIKDFVTSILNNEENEKFEIIPLNEIETVQIIDEHTNNIEVDLIKLNELTMPKPVVEIEDPTKNKKPISIAALFFTIFILVVIAFFFVNPEVIIGKDRNYSCTKNYTHQKLPASVSEEILLTFNGKGNVTNIDVTADYKFTDIAYYGEFKDKSYFYQYMEEGDSYKLIDEEYTYRVFSNIEPTDDNFLPSKESELISYYEQNNYTCKVVEIDE